MCFLNLKHMAYEEAMKGQTQSAITQEEVKLCIYVEEVNDFFDMLANFTQSYFLALSYQLANDYPVIPDIPDMFNIRKDSK